MRSKGLVVFAMLPGVYAIVCAQTPESQIQRSEEHIVVFSGNVMLEDGSPPPGGVMIQRVCGGTTRNETLTDAKGNFSFHVQASGNGGPAPVDATQAPGQASDLNTAIGSSTQYSMPISSALWDCELQAALAGFRSERVSIAQKSGTENVRLGTIILHPLSRAIALTVSATTLQAPSGATKAYEKGLMSMREQKWSAASSAFTKAVKEYPSFAVAWYQLGLALQQQNVVAGAEDAWRHAIKSDPKYVSPYENLTLSADQKGDWAESERISSAWIQLDPDDFPAAYLFNAIANARLNRMDAAERAVRNGLRIDKEHRIPRLDFVLALILLNEHRYTESADFFRAYLQLAPTAKDAGAVRQQLAAIEQATAQTTH